MSSVSIVFFGNKLNLTQPATGMYVAARLYTRSHGSPWTIDRFGNALKLYAYLSNKGCS